MTLSLACLALAHIALGQPPGPSRGVLSKGSLLIEHVNVVPMTKEVVLPDQSVLVTDGRIVAIGDRLPVPAGARRIDGRGKYLIPGLADMHVHLFADDGAPKEDAPKELGVMLANGVTAIRLMIGTPQHLALRSQVVSGEVFGPQIWTASPQLTGKKESNAHTVTTAEQAREAVRRSHSDGYDFIKLTTNITSEVFSATSDEAKRLKVKLIGHVDSRVGVSMALRGGQHIEHLDNYMESALAETSPRRTSVSDVGVFNPANWETLNHIDESKFQALVKQTAESGTYTTPTLTMFKYAAAIQRSEDELRTWPDWKLQPKEHRELYLRAHRRYWMNPPSDDLRKKYLALRGRWVKEIAAAGGRIMAGSDTPEWFLGYGYTLHRELISLVEAGLSPYQALAAATVTPSQFLGAEREWGTLQPGLRADFVMLRENPLDNISNSSKIEAVCIGGRWLDRDELGRMLHAGERPQD